MLVAAILLHAAPSLVSAAEDGADRLTAISSAETRLRKAWISDPTSQAIPFPKLQILQDSAEIRAACPDRPGLRQATGRAVYCPSLSAILVDRSMLGARSDSSETTVPYWIAMGLAEAVRSTRDSNIHTAASTSSVLSSLEHNCLAGVLLAAAGLNQGVTAEVFLAPALSSFPLSKNAIVGTNGQRGYALLTGLGATGLTCTQSDMLALSQNKVPDQEVLTRISDLSRASSSLMAVLNSQCRPRPKALCPRRLNLNASKP